MIYVFFRQHVVLSYVLCFLILTSLFTVLTAQSWYADWVKEPTAQGQAWLLGKVYALCNLPVVRMGRVLLDPVSGFSMEITHVCTGLRVSLIYVCAVLSFPVSWRNRCMGALYGVSGLMALNMIRLFTLYPLGRINRPLFDWVHDIGWDAVILLLAPYFFWCGPVRCC